VGRDTKLDGGYRPDEGLSKSNPKPILFNNVGYKSHRPPLWSSAQSFWPQVQRSRVRSPELADFLSSSGSGTGSTHSPEVN